MTSDLITTSSSTTDATAPRSAGSLLLPIAGGALITGSLLYAAGLATSPPQASMAPADYIESLARDEGQTALSALLLHYGNIALGLGWLAAPTLVRGRRGRWWLLAPAVAAFAASAALTFEPLLYAGFALVGAIPVVLVGLRMLQRNRAEVAAAA